ncbi:unnamed protein product [Urochloa humidicola]
MVRSVHRLLPLLLAACCLLRLPASDCSSSSSPAEEQRKPAGNAVQGYALHHELLHDAEARTARTLEVSAGGGSTSAADHDGDAPSATTTSPAARAEGVVASRPWKTTTTGRALVGSELRPAVLLRSKLARRVLGAGVDVDDAGTDGAGPSCNSSNVHINCPPASSKP